MTGADRPEKRPTFVLKIEGPPSVVGIHALRALLKILLRRYGFRCLDVRQVGGRQ
jgi:hypothetical protein